MPQHLGKPHQDPGHLAASAATPSFLRENEIA
jgi:hypothetical protein